MTKPNGQAVIVCSKCGKRISNNTEPSEDWKYYCFDCGLEEFRKELSDSKKYYRNITIKTDMGWMRTWSLPARILWEILNKGRKVQG